MAVCEYCGGVSYWNEQGLAGTGKRSMLSEGFTRLYRGATGTLRGQRFRVEGRVRYSFGQGFWDEWYVTSPDGASAWLTEDDHELALQTPYDGTGLDVRGLAPGRSFTVDAGTFVVLEVGEARCIGVEGGLPDAILPDDRYDYLDATSPDGKLALGIELDDGQPVLYLGQWLGHHELVLDDEGRA